MFPDYNHLVANLYIAIAKYWLESEEALDLSFLSHVQAAYPKHQLPSWALDWSCQAIATPILDLAVFHAAGDSKALVKVGQNRPFCSFKNFTQNSHSGTPPPDDQGSRIRFGRYSTTNRDDHSIQQSISYNVTLLCRISSNYDDGVTNRAFRCSKAYI